MISGVRAGQRPQGRISRRPEEAYPRADLIDWSTVRRSGMRADKRPERVILRAELRPKWSDFMFERAEFGLEMADFGLNKADLGLLGSGPEGDEVL